MSEALLAAFRRTDYLVCLGPFQWPCIHIDETLPANLRALVGDRSWAFITACNPEAQRRCDEKNDAAQRALFDDLQHQSAPIIHPAIGIGRGINPWYEPSLFVIGPALAAIDALAWKYRQKAFVHGHANGAAELRLLEH